MVALINTVHTLPKMALLGLDVTWNIDCRKRKPLIDFMPTLQYHTSRITWQTFRVFKSEIILSKNPSMSRIKTRSIGQTSPLRTPHAAHGHKSSPMDKWLRDQALEQRIALMGIWVGLLYMDFLELNRSANQVIRTGSHYTYQFVLAPDVPRGWRDPQSG
jgi:hypothetical protein